MVAHCGFDLHFPDGRGCSKLFMSLLAIYISSLGKFCSGSLPLFMFLGLFLSFYESHNIEYVTVLISLLWNKPPGTRIYNRDMGAGPDLMD